MNPGKIKNSRLEEIKILLDSGSSGCLVKEKVRKKLKPKLTTPMSGKQQPDTLAL